MKKIIGLCLIIILLGVVTQFYISFDAYPRRSSMAVPLSNSSAQPIDYTHYSPLTTPVSDLSTRQSVSILATVSHSPLITPTQTEKSSSEPDPIVTFYAEAMKIDYAEAERRLLLQSKMRLVKHGITQDEAFFASWIQHQPIFGLVVSFTTPDGQERIDKYLEGVEWVDLVIVQQSDITRDELNRLRETVEQAAKKTGIAFGSGLNLPTGQVRLYTEQADELQAQLSANAEIVPIIDRIEFVQEAPAKLLGTD